MAMGDGDLDDGVMFEVIEVDGVRYGVVADASDEFHALDEILRALRLGALILVAGACAATWLVCSRALRPVHQITERVAQISAGNLQERVPEPQQDDEIRELATTMNTMLDRLEASQLRRTQFVSDASHELRTPIAVLRNQAEVAQVAPGSTSVESLAEAVLAEADRLGSTVEALLTLARSDEASTAGGGGVAGGGVAGGADGSSPGTGPRRETVDLDEVVLAEVARPRGVRIDGSGIGAGRVVGQVEGCRQIVAHLLDNAARHAATVVAVGVEHRGDRVLFWVEDDGAGIAPADRDRIFQRFTRLDEARSRDAGGSGLGLAVARANAEAMQGTVIAADPVVLTGARFQVNLPPAP